VVKNIKFNNDMVISLSIIIVVFVTLTLASCGFVMEKNKDTRSAVVVSDVFELFNAIKSDNIIKLMPGDYDLSKYSSAITSGEITTSPYASNDNYGESISLENLKNCKIYSDDKVLVYTTNPLADVLILNNSTDITFQNISFGHKIPVGECEGEVISMDGCANIEFQQDDFFGCGIIGLDIANSSNISVIDSDIHDCRYRAVDLNRVSGFQMLRSRIYNTGLTDVGNLFLITYSREVNFKSCRIFDNGNIGNKDANTFYYMFFNTDAEKIVSMTDCTVTNNLYADLDTSLQNSDNTKSFRDPKLTPIPVPTSDPKKKVNPFESFSTVDLSGNPVDYTVFSHNKITMLNIWATWCGPCVAEIPELGKLAKNYSDRGVAVIGILADSVIDENLTRDENTIASGIKILRESDAEYNNLIPDKALYDFIMELEYYPTTLFIDNTGAIVFEKVGSNDYESWAAEIERLLKEVK